MFHDTHHVRVSMIRQQEIVDESVAVLRELSDHLKTCSECIAEDGLACAWGAEIWRRAETAQSHLKRIGIESSVSLSK